MSKARGPALLGLACWTLGAPVAALAMPAARAHLIYVREQGAESCPDEESVRQAVAERLGYNPFSPLAPRTVTVGVRASARQLEATIELADSMGDVSGKRQLTAPLGDCVDLAANLELAIALAIDPLSLMRADMPREEPPEAAPAAQSPVPLPPSIPPPLPAPIAPPIAPVAKKRRPPARAAMAPPGEPTRLRLGVGTLLAFGSEPRVTGGLSLGFGFRQRGWSISVEARGDLPVTASFMGDSYSTAAYLGALVPCLHLPFLRGRMELLACAVIAGGAQYAAGHDLATSNEVKASPMVLLGARGAVEIPLGHRLALLVHAEILGSAYQPQPFICTLSTNGACTDKEVVFTFPASGSLGASLLIYLN